MSTAAHPQVPLQLLKLSLKATETARPLYLRAMLTEGKKGEGTPTKVQIDGGKAGNKIQPVF